jgi:hypothetical protein
VRASSLNLLANGLPHTRYSVSLASLRGRQTSQRTPNPFVPIMTPAPRSRPDGVSHAGTRPPPQSRGPGGGWPHGIPHNARPFLVRPEPPEWTSARPHFESLPRRLDRDCSSVLGLPGGAGPVGPAGLLPAPTRESQPPPPSRTTARRTISQVSMCHHLPTSASVPRVAGCPHEGPRLRTVPKAAIRRGTLRHELKDDHERALCLFKIGHPG